MIRPIEYLQAPYAKVTSVFHELRRACTCNNITEIVEYAYRLTSAIADLDGKRGLALAYPDGDYFASADMRQLSLLLGLDAADITVIHHDTNNYVYIRVTEAELKSRLTYNDNQTK